MNILIGSLLILLGGSGAPPIDLDALADKSDAVVIGVSIRVVLDGEGTYARYAVAEIAHSIRGPLQKGDKIVLPHSPALTGGQIMEAGVTYVMFLARADDDTYSRSHRARLSGSKTSGLWTIWR